MSPCDSYLSTGHVVGLAFNVQASLISLVSIVGLVITILIKYYENCVSPPGGPWRLLRSNLDAFMLNLLAAEFIMALSGLLDLKWVIGKHVYCGRVCSTEGMLTLMGFTATAFFTSAVAIQTWLSVYKTRHKTYSLPVWLGFSAAVWIFVFLFAFLEWVTHRKDGLPGDGSDFYRPTPFWCSINSDYRTARIAGQYFWIWACAFGNIALYVPLFLFSRGNLEFQEIDGSVSWKWHFPARPLPSVSSPTSSEDSIDAQEQQEMRSQAWKLLLYPTAYTLEVLGLSIVRWVTFVTQPNGVSLARDPTLGGYAAAHLTFAFISRLSGFVNVVLIVTTRPNLLLFGSRGLLNPNDPRARAEAKKSSSVGSQDPGGKSEEYLPQFNWFETGGLGQIQAGFRA